MPTPLQMLVLRGHLMVVPIFTQNVGEWIEAGNVDTLVWKR